MGCLTSDLPVHNSKPETDNWQKEPQQQIKQHEENMVRRDHYKCITTKVGDVLSTVGSGIVMVANGKGAFACFERALHTLHWLVIRSIKCQSVNQCQPKMTDKSAQTILMHH